MKMSAILPSLQRKRFLPTIIITASINRRRHHPRSGDDLQEDPNILARNREDCKARTRFLSGII